MKILKDNFNPGAFESRYDSRDYQWLPVANACGIEQVFDWEKGWDSESTPLTSNLKKTN